MEIREVLRGDLPGLLRLYEQFDKGAAAEMGGPAENIWRGILADKNHHVLAAFSGGRLVSSCVLVVVPNLTHGGRPYGLIENVITDEDCRQQGYATALLDYAAALAQSAGCYKLMLMTGSKKESTLRFYEKAGYNKTDKTAFIRWL
ncbi:L-amino acid N-acyltransferase YncA [Sporobacter termitidis DSM 10068]|uniref:L-amino acid N-acyltransferase YncA n=1 Tax=Sporobacter termitidis DSM 10068 TaxID=1123282 RepID=A0A1M5ZB02_9FIRM|nr:GNAT family N-acetyltransferase [Sporobacter termitidis]SHI21421.1 L-amino acid N-acyltransferase YncA [Sporobacter termitidis DSM 10068]